MDAWNTRLSYWVSAYFQGQTVSFREGSKGPRFQHNTFAAGRFDVCLRGKCIPGKPAL